MAAAARHGQTDAEGGMPLPKHTQHTANIGNWNAACPAIPPLPPKQTMNMLMSFGCCLPPLRLSVLHSGRHSVLQKRPVTGTIHCTHQSFLTLNSSLLRVSTHHPTSTPPPFRTPRSCLQQWQAQQQGREHRAERGKGRVGAGLDHAIGRALAPRTCKGQRRTTILFMIAASHPKVRPSSHNRYAVRMSTR